jgi:hypothetical protein
MIDAISSNGTAHMSCSTNASRLTGSKVLEHREQRETDRVREQSFVLRIDRIHTAHDRLGHVRAKRHAQLARPQHVQAHSRDMHDGGANQFARIVAM